ncbi:MAG: PorP/SprF family type IX secretion system membrane protein [Marinoscillum sp.]
MYYSNKLKLTCFGLLILISQNTLLGQNIIPYGLYFNNWKVVNPASTGLGGSQNFDIAYRTNNTKVNGHPSNVLLSYEGQLSRYHSGLGIIFENQQIGGITRVFGKALYNYQIQLNGGNKISIGAGFGMLSETFDYNSIRLLNPNDVVLNTHPAPNKVFDLDLGMTFKSENIQGGIAIKNLIPSKSKRSEVLGARTVQLVTAYVEYKIEFDKFRFIPSICSYTDYEHVIFDINPTLEFMKRILIGGTLRLSDDDSLVNVNAGIYLNENIRLTGIVYSSGYEGAGNNFEFSLGIRIDQE